MSSEPSTPARLHLRRPLSLHPPSPSPTPTPRRPITTHARTLSHASSTTARRLGLARKSAYLQELLTGHNHARDEYDGEYKRALLEGEVGTGVRTWYSSFTSIDWLHDQCKEDFRLRTLRARKGLRGVAANSWDRFQGWLAVVLVGLLTAIIAAGIIALEGWLFSIKDGYCATGWWRARRFCTCPTTTTPITLNRHAGVGATGPVQPKLRSALGKGAFIAAWARVKEEQPGCEAWKEWGAVLDGRGSRLAQWAVEYGIYIVLAVSFATFASVLTIYLSASDQVVSTKDIPSTSSPHAAGESLRNALSSERAFDKRDSRVPRTHSFPSYGGVDFGAPERGARAGLSRSTSRNSRLGLSESEPLLNDRGFRTDDEATAHGKCGNASENVAAPTVAPRKVMYFAAGSGIPEIKTLLGGFVIRGYLGGWTLLAKAIGLCFSVGSGLSLGKEGPFVHIASCVGNIVSRFFAKFDRNEAKRRELLSAACAAGVAVSFGAPVGGVLFSLEEVSYFFPPKVLFRSFVCAMVAATVLKALDPFGSGKIVLFEVTYDKDWHFAELLGFAALGVFGGLYGALFNKANLAWVKRVRNGTALKRHPILEVAAVCLVTVAISFLNRFTKMGGTELVYEMFSECSRDDRDDLSGLCVRAPSEVRPLVGVIGFALVAKALLTVITFGIKLPAGIFIPTLAVGACFGRILGLLVEYGNALNPGSPLFGFCTASGPLPAPFGQACVLPGVWAVVGAAATLAGVTRTTVSLAVIIFELTGTLTYVTPVMLAVLFAKTVADAIETRSIYDLTIEANNLPYLDAKEEHILHGSVMDVTDTDASYISLDDGNSISTLGAVLSSNAGLVTGFPILKEDDGVRLQGYIGFDELEQAVEAYRAEHEGDEPATPCTFRDTSARVDLEPLASDDVRASSGDMLDLGYLADRAPVTIGSRAPLQLVHQLFVKLGVRYIAVQDERGCYVGMIEKNRWLGYLKWLESQHE